MEALKVRNMKGEVCMLHKGWLGVLAVVAVAGIVEAAVPRPEYPRMQFRREQSWINLNGEWNFEFDHGRSGVERKLYEHPELFTQKIVVPFCPESKLSGLGHTDFVESVFYHREIEIPAEWADKKILLNFGGVDYHARIWIDGKEAGWHTGGSSPFSVDITQFVKPGGKHQCVVQAVDLVRSREQGLGKQSSELLSSGCTYTRVTGIWQTVWLEAVHPQGLAECHIVPCIDTGNVMFTPRFHSTLEGDRFRITVLKGEQLVRGFGMEAVDGYPMNLVMEGYMLWEPNQPFLYDVVFEVMRDGKVIDRVESYFAMRRFSIKGNRLYLNHEPIFMRMVLDQGFYPDGIWTAPSDAELKGDIERAMAMGFNGARLHQKVFEDRFHYWADKLGYLTWAEYPSWGMDLCSARARENFLSEWPALVRYLRNHPSIAAWTPLNETVAPSEVRLAGVFWDGPDGLRLRQYRDWVTAVYDTTKAIDPTRPINDVSGYVHVKTDIWTVHPYCPDAKSFGDFIFSAAPKAAVHVPKYEVPYSGQPYVVDEFGGFKYSPEFAREKMEAGWGYHGLQIKTEDELIAKIREQVNLMVASPLIAGYCYTQLTDVEQEQNGVYTYDRKPKVNVKKMAEVFGAKPSWSAY